MKEDDYLVKWFTSILFEGNWYEQVYLYSFFIFLFGIVLFLILIIPYNNISEIIESEYRALSSKHFFISFRKRKSRELYAKAKRKASMHRNYPLYQIANIFLYIASFSLVVGIWFFAGSFVYEKMILKPDSYTGYEEEYDYGEESVDIESDIHHVDPHWVDGYNKSDGTQVEGYWRGGDDGYYRSNPDDDTSNNLGTDSESYDSDDWSAESDGYDGIGGEIGEYFFGN